MSRQLLMVAVAWALCWGVPAVAEEPAETCRSPIQLERKNPVLQTQLIAGLQRAGLGKPLDRKELAVSLLDLTPAGEGAYAGINDDFMMYAASLPKIAILLAMAEEVNSGAIVWGPDFSWRLTKMITISDNSFATWGARTVGLKRIGEVMKSPRYCFYEPGIGGLWMGRTFEKEALTHREPLKSLSNAATTRQTARFYALLDARELVTPYWSSWMLAHMGPPEYVHKFYKALRDQPGVRFPARKSGTWQNWHSDSALIEHGSRRFVLAALADHEDGEAMLEAVARVADGVIERGEHRWWR